MTSTIILPIPTILVYDFVIGVYTFQPHRKKDHFNQRELYQAITEFKNAEEHKDLVERIILRVEKRNHNGRIDTTTLESQSFLTEPAYLLFHFGNNQPLYSNIEGTLYSASAKEVYEQHELSSHSLWCNLGKPLSDK